MEEFSLRTILAVFEEMFGAAVFWAMVVVAVVITLAWLWVLLRDRALSMRKFLLAQLSMPVGGVAAVWFVMLMTNSGFADIGGPIDWLVLLGVFMAGAVGFAILVYVVQSFLRGRAIQART